LYPLHKMKLGQVTDRVRRGVCRLEGGFLTGERVVRRLAAILAADVVGYSRLMGRDENGTLARLANWAEVGTAVACSPPTPGQSVLAPHGQADTFHPSVAATLASPEVACPPARSAVDVRVGPVVQSIAHTLLTSSGLSIMAQTPEEMNPHPAPK
jgi:hypothetical protein